MANRPSHAHRKKTRSDQCLNFSSHHQLHQKLVVINTLLDRCSNVVSEDREKEVAHITKALGRCGHPNWTIEKMKEHQSQKEKTKKRKDKQTNPHDSDVSNSVKLHKDSDTTE